MTNPKIDACKKDFATKFDAFLRECAEELGDHAQWKMAGWAQSPRENQSSRFSLVSLQDANKTLTFSMAYSPADFTKEETLQLRKYMNDYCAVKGFMPTTPRITQLSSDIIEGVRQGDPAAWNSFVSRHRKNLTRYAEKKLAGDNNSILEADDMVNRSLRASFVRSLNGDIKSPISWVGLTLLGIIHTVKENNPLRRQSDEEIVRAHATTKKQDMDALAYLLPKMLEEAKTHMSPQQQNVLDVIINNQSRDNGSLTVNAIAQQLDISKATAHSHLDDIVLKILEVARKPEYREARVIIERLAKANYASGKSAMRGDI